jgi:hypothetical protein
MRVALDMVLTVSCLFYTLFLFDTLGDAVGFNDAYWVLIFVPLLPVSFLTLRAALSHWRPPSAPAATAADASARGIAAAAAAEEAGVEWLGNKFCGRQGCVVVQSERNLIHLVVPSVGK